MADSSDFSDVTSPPFLSAASFGSFHRISFPAFHPRGGQEGPHRRAEALVTHGRHRIPRGASPQRNDGNPRGLDDPLLSRGFDLVARVTSRSIVSHSYLRPLSVVLVKTLQ
jgi:hypothetical protein